ncbi:YhdP family protein [Vulcaniibacterium gelatinicum]|uniref:YhdP family protein n=1 Tax=Vulcaniibacterium gelatinicum TaxID=2598725 RepID=UPI001FEAA5EB|nr:YhdP family protein [Vulcaniibacterium gelatinicum]
MTRLRRHLRIARRTLWYAVAVTLVLMAVVSGVLNELLPLVERHPARIAAWLSERAGRPVAFDAVDTAWTRRGPLLRLEGLRVGEGAQTLEVGDAELLVSQYAGLLPGRSFTELRLRGLDLTLERADDGRWRVRGLPGQERPGGDPLGTLEGLGELQVIGARLRVLAPSLGIDARVPKLDLRLRVDGDRVRAGAHTWMHADTAPLVAVLDFDRKRGDGRAWAQARRVELAHWSPLLRLAGVRATGGEGEAQAWAVLRGHRIASVTVDADLRALALAGTPVDAGAQAPAVRFGEARVQARWQALPGGWRFDAPTLRLGAGEEEQRLDGLLLAGGTRQAVVAERVDAGPLLAVLALSDRLPPGLRRWLVAARPRLVLEEVELAGGGGPLQARGRIVALAFPPIGNTPGLRGLTGAFEGDARGFRFVPDPQARVVFDWPPGFGVEHVVALQGTISGWREGAGWRVGTDSLHVRGRDFGARVRGGLWWQGDGSRPWIDLAAAIDESAVPAAKGFWVRHLMPDAAERWLDAALVAGRVLDGRAVVSGDLDDWPFRDGTGLFRADARIADATLKFDAGWPAAERVEADVSFVADGFRVAGRGALAGVGIRRFEAGIERFGKAPLIVHAEGGGDAARLLALLRRSPLEQEYGDTLANLSASGAADVSFDLRLPLGTDVPMRLGGTVDVRNASLRERRWNLAFDQVRGRAEYGQGGFVAEQLAVRHAGQPGRLTLRAGGYVRDPAQGFEAELEASLAARDLLARAEQFDWLLPYVEGRSPWTVAVAIPKTAARGAAAAPTRLMLRSNLVGTELRLPLPLRKPAEAPLAATIDTALPIGSGETRVTLGGTMTLRARKSGAQTGVRVALGGVGADDAPPPSGLVVTGRTTDLEVLDWVAVARGGGDDGLPLRRVDVSAERLHLVGAAFPQARLQVAPATGGISVNVAGPALAGTLTVPDADGAAISGRFERMHWRPAPHTDTTADGDADGTDPARIPPLALDIAELRVVDAALGQATLRTRPVPGGMRIEQLRTRAREQRVDVTGEWLGRGDAATTQLQATVDSDDFGALLAGLGLGGQLAGGDGSARLEARWRGSPAAFRPVGTEGTLVLDVRDGRLLEVEPGAGRVLGLLGIAQLPRRLMLDFSDFFAKGFSFDRLGGEIRLTQGRARSEDLRIDGPAALIRIRGEADLRAQSFDQTIEVLPKAGNLLTVAGALAGGPVGAAIGAAANAMLNKPLREMAAKTYRVTGPWKDPKVEVIRREPGATAAKPTPPSG